MHPKEETESRNEKVFCDDNSEEVYFGCCVLAILDLGSWRWRSKILVWSSRGEFGVWYSYKSIIRRELDVLVTCSSRGNDSSIWFFFTKASSAK